MVAIGRAKAAELAMTRWVRVKANMSLGAYEISVAESAMSDQTWPEMSFRELSANRVS